MGSIEVVHKTTELIQQVRDKLRFAQSGQKRYADRRRSELKFQVGELVFLKVSPWKGFIRFRKRGKLGPRFIGLFRISTRVGKGAYWLDFPDELNQIHNTFHVSQIQKFLANDYVLIPLDDIQVDESMNYVERPIAILDRQTKTLRNKVVNLVKVRWKHQRGFE